MNSAATTNMNPRPRPGAGDMSQAGSTAGSSTRRTMATRRQAEDAADLDELAVDALDGAGDAEIDREEHAHRDERHLGSLEDAEPEQEQRHPGDRRDGAQGLQGRVEQRGAGLRWPASGAHERAGGGAERRSPRGRATASPDMWSKARPSGRGRRAWRRCATAAASAGPERARPHRRSHPTASASGSRMPSASRRARRRPAARRGARPAPAREAGAFSLVVLSPSGREG